MAIFSMSAFAIYLAGLKSGTIVGMSFAAWLRKQKEKNKDKT